MTQEQIEYDEEQYRNFDASLESLIGKEYCYQHKSGESITVKFKDKEILDVTFIYDNKYINTESCIVDTKFDFSYYNILSVAIDSLLIEFIDELLDSKPTPAILMGFLINYKDLEIS